MHKFFYSYNPLTERFELSLRGNNFLGATISSQTLLPKIKENIESLYEMVVLIKEGEKDEEKLKLLDETELLISNLYGSLFSSPLEEPKKKTADGSELEKAVKLISEIIKMINIPEYNRLCSLIQTNLGLLEK